MKYYYKNFKQIAIPKDRSNLKKSYFELLRNNRAEGLTDIKLEIIKSLENKFLFYRYRTVNQYTVDSIKNKKIWFSTPDCYNDPFEFHFKLGNEKFLDMLKDEIDQSDLEDIIKIQEKAYERRETSKQEFSICCFMENDKNNLMWSHYANCHKGFCIEYDLSKACFYDFLHPIYYTKDVIEFPKNYAQVCTTKSEEWSYESEWRMIYSGHSGLEDAPPIKSICLGAKFEIEDELSKELLEIISRRKIPTYKMEVSKIEYSLIKKVQ